MDVYQRRRLIALSALAAVFVILVLLIRSCGGDEQTTSLTGTVPGATGTGGATPLSQKDFASQGDSICLQTNTSLASVDATDEQQAATDRAELLAGELDSLQSLTLAPGEKGKTKLENFLEALQKEVQAYDERSLAVERGDDAAVSEIDATIDDSAAEAQRAAKRFGFDACGDTSKVGQTSGGQTTSGGTATTTAVTPTTTTPVTPTTTTPVTPPTDTGGGAAPAPPTDTGGDSSGSGGITP
jgi:hypothetical protein